MAGGSSIGRILGIGESNAERIGCAGVPKAGEDEGIGFSFSMNRLIVGGMCFCRRKMTDDIYDYGACRVWSTSVSGDAFWLINALSADRQAWHVRGRIVYQKPPS
jgi:hypothetical protein